MSENKKNTYDEILDYIEYLPLMLLGYYLGSLTKEEISKIKIKADIIKKMSETGEIPDVLVNYLRYSTSLKLDDNLKKEIDIIKKNS